MRAAGTPSGAGSGAGAPHRPAPLTIDAFHLPGLDAGAVAPWDERTYGAGDVVLRFPRLDPETWLGTLRRIRAARDRALAERPVREIVEVIDAAARRFADPEHPTHRLAEAALPAITGYSPPMVRLILDRMAADWTAGPLTRLLESELGDPRVLDEFVPAPPGDRRTRALGPRLAFHIFAGNVPGVAVTSLIRTLLVKSATAGKTASGEPLLATLFARALAECDAELGECMAVTWWPGGTEPLEALAFQEADTVVVYGGERTEQAVRSRVPAGTRLVAHGPRFSCGLIGREATGAPDLARDVAYAVAAFDQQGCVSPHAIYVERGGAVPPDAFAALLARALGDVERTLPRGRIDAAEAAAIHDLRGAAEFRAHAGGRVAVHAGPGTSYTVIYEEDPAFAPSCLNRVVWVKPLDRLEDAEAVLRPYAHLLQTVGLAADEARRATIAERVARLGASRVTSFQAMPWPPAHWHHDGIEPIRSLLRWTDLDG